LFQDILIEYAAVKYVHSEIRFDLWNILTSTILDQKYRNKTTFSCFVI